MNDVVSLHEAVQLLAEVDIDRRRFESYAAYRTSESPLAMRLPQHWIVKKVKYVSTLTTDKGGNDGPKIGLEQIEGFTGKLLDVVAEYDGDGVAFQPNDILYGKLRPYLAKVHLAEFRGLAVGDFFVLRPRAEMEPHFVQYALLDRTFTNLANGSTFGAKMPRVDWRFQGDLKFPVPPLDEQEVIARFLDRETAKIDSLVAKKRRLIESLAEKRTALISHVVTKGLNPDAPVTPSGIDWLGDVPAHWDISRTKYAVGKIGSGKTPKGGSEVYVSSGVMLLRSQNVYDDGLRLDDVVFITEEVDEEMAGTRVSPGDVLLNITGASIGRCGLVSDQFPPANVNQHVCIIRPRKVQPAFLHAVMCSKGIKDWIAAEENGTSREGLNFRQVGNIALPIPPTDEQTDILRDLIAKTSRIENLISRVMSVIDRLVEYRSTLISAAVTGQIDVRNEVADAH